MGIDVSLGMPHTRSRVTQSKALGKYRARSAAVAHQVTGIFFFADRNYCVVVTVAPNEPEQG